MAWFCIKYNLQVVHMERKSEAEWIKSATGQLDTYGKLRWMYILSHNFRKLKDHLMMTGKQR